MRAIICLLMGAILTSTAFAQAGVLRGRAQDQTGAVIPNATVMLRGPAGIGKTASTDEQGGYVFYGLLPGEYAVTATAPGLAMLEPVRISVSSGSQTLDLQLSVVLAEQKMNIEEGAAPAVTIDVATNASAVVLRGEQLKALGESPEDLQTDLQALAGPSAGPGGAATFIDGFSGGQLPSKDSIREIRINQNPFSPEYDRFGLGRIEVFTKPGSDKLRGSVFYNFAHHFWNSRNPYASEKAPFLLQEYGGNISGSLKKRSSYFLDVRRDQVDNGSIVNAITLDPQSLAIISPFTDTPKSPQRRISINPRLDVQLSDRHTVTMRYVFTQSHVREAGLGGFNLASRGFQVLGDNQTLQLTETAVLGTSVINETRFQFLRTDGETIANTLSPAIQVLGSFTGGGAQVGQAFNRQNAYEFQNYTSVARKTHYWRFGVRARGEVVDSLSPQNFGGTFTFGGGSAPVLDAGNQAVRDASGGIISTPITSIERYRRTLLFGRLGYTASRIRELGGGATQFALNAGDPLLSAYQLDAGLFVGDDWRVRPNLTLSYGVRYESQTNLDDRSNFAPRVGLAWSPGADGKKTQPKTVLRAGFGIFYERFALPNTITALRFNGVVQQQYIVMEPDFFPTIPPLATLAAYRPVQTIQRISSGLRAPYLMQSSASFERQLPFHLTLALTYVNSHGQRMLRSQNINAPLPGTYNPAMPGSGAFPFGKAGPVFQVESTGRYNQHQIIANLNARLTKNHSFIASYTLNRALSDTDGIATFPAKPYSFIGEYGPAATDVRHRLSLTGNFSLKWNLRLSPLLTAESGPPFDLTVGRDLYGTTLFNARPGIAGDPNKPGLIRSRYGLLDPNPSAEQPLLPRNFGRGPGQVMLNLRIAKVIEFGGERAAGKATRQGSASPTHPYSLSMTMSIRNLLNRNNPGPIIGNITSPLFGQANQPAGGAGFIFSEAANNRRLELQLRFSF